MKTPHTIGNNGEAPFDAEPGIAVRLRRLSDDLEDAYSFNASGTQCYGDPDTIDTVARCLEEIADEIEEYEKRHGTAL